MIRRTRRVTNQTQAITSATRDTVAANASHHDCGAGGGSFAGASVFDLRADPFSKQSRLDSAAATSSGRPLFEILSGRNHKVAVCAPAGFPPPQAEICLQESENEGGMNPHLLPLNKRIERIKSRRLFASPPLSRPPRSPPQSTTQTASATEVGPKDVAAETGSVVGPS
jgi:hypothetical protein